MTDERIVSVEVVRPSQLSLSSIASVAGTDPTLRFSMELEFVELLANPDYLHHLSTNGYLDNPAFVAYIEYLQYWRTSEYIVYISFPQALLFLQLLQHATFRQRCAQIGFIRHLEHSQIYHAKWFRHNRAYERQELDRAVDWLLAEADAANANQK